MVRDRAAAGLGWAKRWLQEGGLGVQGKQGRQVLWATDITGNDVDGKGREKNEDEEGDM